MLYIYKSNFIEKAFFLLPFCLLGGAFLQGLGFYGVVILLPFILQYKTKDLSVLSFESLFFQMSLIGLGLFFLFPFVSYIALFFDSSLALNRELNFSYILRSFFKTPVSSVVGGSGLFFLILFFLGRFFSKKNFQKKDLVQNVISFNLNNFHLGMLAASLFLLIYVWLQHAFGFDYREPSFFLSENKKLLIGTYRSLGFFGHPLSLASVSLALLGYYLTLFKEKIDSSLSLRKIYLGICVCHFIMLSITGSRMPFFIGVCFIIFVFGASFNKRFSLIKSLSLFFLILFILSFSFFYFGLHNRYMELWQLFQSGGLNRTAFWSVYWQMFLDKPFFGQGSLWITQGIRDHYYLLLGYTSLPEKYNAHNIYLEILASAGIIGSIAVIFCLLKAKFFLKKNVKNQDGQIFLKAFGSALFLNAIHGLTQNTFFDTNLIYIYWTFLWIFLWQNS